MPSARQHVVIAGAGVAGLEALVALHGLAGERVDITLVSPSTRFGLRADAVDAAFGRPAPVQHDVAMIADDHGARYLRDALHVVHREYATVLTESGRELRYDSLLVAVGAQTHPHPALHDALTFWGMDDVPAMAELLADVDAGRARSVMFVVPPGATWTLPAYDLALLCAQYTIDRSLDIAITIATPEPAPVAALGRQAGDAMTASLDAGGIRLRSRLPSQRLNGDRLLDLRGHVLASADRVVALPEVVGPRLRGLPHDRDGFIAVDATGAIRGVPDAFGAGDATTVPFKQGGLAAQQAAVAAHAIARAAGADVAATTLAPTLRAHAAAGTGATWFSTPLRASSEGSAVVSDAPLWHPSTKVSMPYLASYLRRVDARIAE
jgi:sulfide:quinone oxidoreductase